MKHNFLRRLSALTLAVVMAVSLCVTPAWAAEGASQTPEFDRELIVLKDHTSANVQQLTLKGLAVGDEVTWTRTGDVTVNGSSTVSEKIDEGDLTPSGEYVSVVNVSASSSPTHGEVRVRVTRSGSTLTTLPCYVYCGEAPFLTMPSEEDLNRAGLTAPDGTLEIVIRVNQHADLISKEKITFESSIDAVATVEPEATFSSGAYRAVVTGHRTGPVTITMKLQGYSFEWELNVTPAPGIIPVSSVRIAPNYLEMTAKDTRDALTATVEPQDATNKTVTWYSNNTSVVQVDRTSGEITAVGAGRTEIYAMADGVHSNSCIVEVAPAPESVTLDNTTLLLDVTKNSEKSKRLTATADPALGTTFDWRTSNASVADFNGAATATTGSVLITGKKEGTAVITVTATFTDANNRKITKTAQCTVTVIDANSKPVNQITLSETSHSMPADGSFNLSVTSFNPSSVLDKTIKWDISDKSVAELETVNETTVKVTAKKEGTVRITATANFGSADEICEVTVTPIAETITLSGFNYDSNTPGTNKYTYTFRNSGNDYINVRATLGPTGAADPIHWSSENTSVATVTDTTGTQASVTAAGAGRTTITAVPMDPDGKDRVLEAGPAEITVTVSGIAIVNDDAAALTSITLMDGQRRQIQSLAYGSAFTGDHSVDWTSSDPSVVSVNPKSSSATTITARKNGTAIITARKGTFSASCSVTVTEDTAGLITVSTTPGTAYQFSNLVGSLNAACTTKTGAGLAYITSLSVSSTDQGILHDRHHSSADTGAGVGAQDRYYPGTAPQGQRSLSDLSFVPRNTFSGTAEINYTAWSTNNKSVSGVIRVTVNGTGDVTYASNEGSAVTFLSDDFNLYHPNLRSVSFTLPLESRGTLYYNYSSASQPGTKVTASDAYHRTGSPSLDRVTFVPASGYTGTVAISYRGTDTAGRTFNGTVTITVNGGGGAGAPGDLYYHMTDNGATTFRPTDFSTASLAILGESLSYVRFSPPPSADGTLFYNYRGFGNYDGTVASTTSYYYSGTPSLSGVSFVPTTTTPSRVDISYTGYTVKGNTFTGTIHIGQDSAAQQQNGLRYTVYTGRTVYFNANDFNAACVSATGASLDYVLFSPLPAVGEGTLRYTRGSSSTTYDLSTSTRCYHTSTNSWNTLLSGVSFLANNSYTGTVTIPFTGYNTNGTSFTSQVVVTVTPPTTGDSVYSGTTASPLQLSSSRMRSACSGVLDGTLSYITFTSLPNASAGRLYQDYNGFGTGTQVNTGTRYYVSGTYPSIDQISFVPRGRYSGQVTVPYTATNTYGRSVTGILTFNIANSGNSSYFYDMGYHNWAAPSVDYLYQNNVTNGVTASSFGPDQHILRCDFVLMLCRAFNFYGGGGYSFADVPTNAYFANAVATAKQLGIVNGDGVNFMPYSELTRQDAMVMIRNALTAARWNVTDASTSILGRFPDGVSVSSYARTAVSTLINMGAVSGDNGMLYPFNPITRAEAAVILHFIMTM